MKHHCQILCGSLKELIRWLSLFHLGMLIAGFLIRNIEYVSKVIVIKVQWGVIFRNVALSIILSLAGLGLDAKVEY